MRRHWALWVMIPILVLALAACGKDKKNTPKGNPTQPAAESTEQLTPGYTIGTFQPLLRARTGLTLVSSNDGVVNGTFFFYAECRNDTQNYFSQIDAHVYPLSAEGVQLDDMAVSPAVTDIPPGQSFFVGGSFPVPAKFAGSQRWVWFESAPKPSLDAHFNLPTTTTFQGASSGMAYLVRGTATNNSNKVLLFPVIDVMLFTADGKPVGLTHAVLHVSAADGTWPAGETAQFEAAFGFVAVDASQVTQVKVSAVGYTQLQ